MYKCNKHPRTNASANASARGGKNDEGEWKNAYTQERGTTERRHTDQKNSPTLTPSLTPALFYAHPSTNTHTHTHTHTHNLSPMSTHSSIQISREQNTHTANDEVYLLILERKSGDA
jgi:hypothetical protein